MISRSPDRICRKRWGFRWQRELLFLYLHGTTLMLTVAVLLARLGSGVSAMVAALSVITVPAGAVTFTVTLTVHVVLGAMALFSWQTICPVP